MPMAEAVGQPVASSHDRLGVRRPRGGGGAGR
jgi:hypothetical protein